MYSWWNSAYLSKNQLPDMPGYISPLCLWAFSLSGLMFHSAISHSLKQTKKQTSKTPLWRPSPRFSSRWSPSFSSYLWPSPIWLWNPWKRTIALSLFIFRATLRAVMKFSFGKWLLHSTAINHSEIYVSSLSWPILATPRSLTELSRGVDRVNLVSGSAGLR